MRRFIFVLLLIGIIAIPAYLMAGFFSGGGGGGTGSGDFKKDGSVAMTGDLNLGGNDITNGGTVNASSLVIGTTVLDDGSVSTCDATTRGHLQTVQGGAGIADQVRTCNKAADGSYAWQTLLPGTLAVTEQPTFDHDTGTYNDAVSIAMSCATGGAVICYTTDGNNPSASGGVCLTGTQYSTPVSVSATGTTVKALATKPGNLNSTAKVAVYTLQVAPVTATPGSGPTVALASTTPSTAIHYRTDGTAAACSDTTYSTALSISGTQTITAIGCKSNYVDSAAFSKRYMAADVFGHMNVADAVGTTITAAIAQNGMSGTTSWGVSTSPLTGMTVAASQGNKRSTVLLANGLAYDSETSYKSIAFDHAQAGRKAIYYPSGSHASGTFGGYITIGPANISPSGNLFDLFLVKNGNGRYSTIQLNNGAGPGNTYALNLESDASGTTHSSYFTVTPGTRYYFSLYVNFTSGSSELYLYDALSYSQVGHVTVAVATGSTISEVYVGNNEWGTSSGRTSYFEHLVVNWSDPNPLLP